MKRKIFLCLFALVGIVTITGCGSNSTTKASIVDNEGNKVEMTAKELLDINSENEKKFEKYYKGAKIELTEKVKEVSSCSGCIYDIVYLENDWEVVFSKDYYDLADLNKGDKVHIKSTIAGKDPEHYQNIMAIYGVRKSDKEKITFEVVK